MPGKEQRTSEQSKQCLNKQLGFIDVCNKYYLTWWQIIEPLRINCLQHFVKKNNLISEFARTDPKIKTGSLASTTRVLF